MTTTGFELEMRLIQYENNQPKTYVGVGGFKFSPEKLQESLSAARIRFHMISDQLLNGAVERLESGDTKMDEINDQFTAGQIHELADLVARGEASVTVTARSLTGNRKAVLFTFST